jgi:hypothetical protein
LKVKVIEKLKSPKSPVSYKNLAGCPQKVLMRPEASTKHFCDLHFKVKVIAEVKLPQKIFFSCENEAERVKKSI